MLDFLEIKICDFAVSTSVGLLNGTEGGTGEMVNSVPKMMTLQPHHSMMFGPLVGHARFPFE